MKDDNTWIFGFAAEQSERQAAFNVLVPIDGRTNTCENLYEENES